MDGRGGAGHSRRPGIEFNLSTSDWFRLFAEVGFDGVDFFEIQALESADGDRFPIPADWAEKVSVRTRLDRSQSVLSSRASEFDTPVSRCGEGALEEIAKPAFFQDRKRGCRRAVG